MAFPPRKTIVGPTGATPFKTVAQSTGNAPIKTVVRAPARPPVKTVVGNLAAPRPKTLVGSTAAPPMKTTPGNLGKGGISSLGAGFDQRPNNAANPSRVSRSLGNGDGNLGRSVAPMPKPAGGPPNPAMNWNESSGADAILPGGMGAAAKSMGRAPSRGRGSRRGAFYGG
jgi:hypothetical protein